MSDDVKQEQLAAEHEFTKRLREIDAEVEKRRNRCQATAAGKAGKVHKWHLGEIEKATAECNSARASEGSAHRKRLKRAKAVHNSEMGKIERKLKAAKQDLGEEKTLRLDPIEGELKKSLLGVDEWKSEQTVIAEQERLEAISKAEAKTEEKTENEKK